MKKFYTIIVALFITATTFAQAPEKISYQAVVRDSDGNLLASQAVGMRISILQTTASGTAVYVEARTPSTNANGLVSVEIGAGSVISGNFNAIDWGAGTYFIKTETDPAGGTNYTITGTSQLLSVPYALHAKTAGSITETQTLTDVISLGNTANSQIKGVSNPTEGQDAATKAYVDGLTAEYEARIAALESSITDLASRVTALQPATIGDFRAGGVVFWVDPADNKHGLVCALVPQHIYRQWWVYSDTYFTGATSPDIGTGAANTTTIVAKSIETGALETDYAAGVASIYTGGGYTDWFLPSKDELNQMYLNRDAINTTSIANGGDALSLDFTYWSSTASNSSNAWTQDLGTGWQGSVYMLYPGIVRAVRVF